MITPLVALSILSTVTASSQQFAATTMALFSVWSFCSDVACYIAVGADPTAAPSSGSMYAGANQIVLLSGGGKVAVIRAGGVSGIATLTPLESRAF